MGTDNLWETYGKACRARGSLALQVFACITSPARPGPPPEELLAAHLEYQKDIESRGQLFLAGPLSDPSGLNMSGSGLIIYAARTMAEAQNLAEGDPMHQSGQRTFILQAWRINEGAPFAGVRLSSSSIAFADAGPSPER